MGSKKDVCVSVLEVAFLIQFDCLCFHMHAFMRQRIPSVLVSDSLRQFFSGRLTQDSSSTSNFLYFFWCLCPSPEFNLSSYAGYRNSSCLGPLLSLLSPQHPLCSSIIHTVAGEIFKKKT